MRSKRSSRAQYLPWAVTIPVAPGTDDAARDARLPWLDGDAAREAARRRRTSATSFTCQAPVTDPAALDPSDSTTPPRRVVIVVTEAIMSVAVAFNEELTRASLVFAHPTGNILTSEMVAPAADGDRGSVANRRICDS